MQRSTNYLTAVCLSLALAVTAGCSEATTASAPTGAIEITVSTVGEDIDLPASYTLRIDNQDLGSIGINATLRLGGIPKGMHVVQLVNLASNCSTNDEARRSVDVNAETPPFPVSFSVSCRKKSTSGGCNIWYYPEYCVLTSSSWVPMATSEALASRFISGESVQSPASRHEKQPALRPLSYLSV